MKSLWLAIGLACACVPARAASPAPSPAAAASPAAEASPAEPEAKVKVAVKAEKVHRAAIAAEVSAMGSVTPLESAVVNTRIAGVITKMERLKDHRVERGQVLARVAARELDAQRIEAELAVEEARINERNVLEGTIPQADAQVERDLHDAEATARNAHVVYRRRQELFRLGGLAKKELEASALGMTTADGGLLLARKNFELRKHALDRTDRELAHQKVELAQKRLAAVEVQLGFGVVTAPIAGVVTEQAQFAGEYVAAGAKLVSLARVDQVLVRVPFPDAIVLRLKPGDPAVVAPAAATSEGTTGAISLISPVTDSASRTVEVVIQLPNRDGRFRVNQAVRVTVATARAAEGIVVPRVAVTLDSPDAPTGTVMVVGTDEKAHQVKVQIGILAENEVQVVSGLKGDETIITEGNFSLADDTPVEVAGEKKPGEKDDKDGKLDEKPDASASPGSPAKEPPPKEGGGTR